MSLTHQAGQPGHVCPRAQQGSPGGAEWAGDGITVGVPGDTGGAAEGSRGTGSPGKVGVPPGRKKPGPWEQGKQEECEPTCFFWVVFFFF